MLFEQAAAHPIGKLAYKWAANKPGPAGPSIGKSWPGPSAAQTGTAHAPLALVEVPTALNRAAYSSDSSIDPSDDP